MLTHLSVMPMSFRNFRAKEIFYFEIKNFDWMLLVT